MTTQIEDLFHTMHFNLHECEKLVCDDGLPTPALELLAECRDIIDDMLSDMSPNPPRYVSYEELLSVLRLARRGNRIICNTDTPLDCGPIRCSEPLPCQEDQTSKHDPRRRRPLQPDRDPDCDRHERD